MCTYSAAAKRAGVRGRTMAAVQQPHVPRRLARTGLSVLAPALLALALLAPQATSPGTLVDSAYTQVFAVPDCSPPSASRARNWRSSEAQSLLARAAGKEGSPGPKPVLDGEVEEPADSKRREKLRPGHESLRMQASRVTKRTRFLKSIKGRFVPWGPKPWDEHRFTKVCIQSRLKSKQASNTKIINQVVEEIRRISGQHPVVVKAKHDVNAFGWRKGANCGVAVNLKGQLMFDFLHRLNTIILPRVRDFEGLFPNSFDNYGNFWMGFDSQEPFRELDELVDTRELVHGFDVGILNNCLTQPDALALMKSFGFPFGDPRPMKALKVKKSFVEMRPQ